MSKSSHCFIALAIGAIASSTALAAKPTVGPWNYLNQDWGSESSPECAATVPNQSPTALAMNFSLNYFFLNTCDDPCCSKRNSLSFK